jgi:L-alanine-DL-glutamate epimerase-like enolase superfamily enzyme
MSKIVAAEIHLVDLQPTVPRSDAIQAFESQETPIVVLKDSDGREGVGYTYTIGTGGSSIVALLKDHLLPKLLGRDSDEIESIWFDLARSINALRVGAVAALSLAVIDTALWDLRAKKVSLPLYKLAGGAKKSIPVYSTEGGWLHLSQDQLVQDALERKASGFTGTKIKVGKPTLQEDVRRLSAVRDAVGPDWTVLIDANQSFSVGEAIRRARAFEDLSIGWFEEPMPADDVVGHERLAASTSIPVAVGESMYSLTSFREYLHRNAASVVQVDVARIGGITPWLKTAHLAEAYNVAVAPHFLMELHVSLVCAVQASSTLEYIPQLDKIVNTKMKLENGTAYPSEDPGLGIDWNWQAINELGQSWKISG